MSHLIQNRIDRLVIKLSQSLSIQETAMIVACIEQAVEQDLHKKREFQDMYGTWVIDELEKLVREY